MNSLACCSNFEDLHEQFELEWDAKAGGFEMSLREPNRNTGSGTRFLLTLYYCPYCGSDLAGDKYNDT